MFKRERCKKTKTNINNIFTRPILLMGRVYKSKWTLSVEVGPEWPWGLFWALKKALKWVNPLKKVLKRVNPLFWVLKKVLKKVTVLKWALKKVLFWVISSKKCSKSVCYSKEYDCSKKGSIELAPQKNAQKSGSGSSGHRRSLSCRGFGYLFIFNWFSKDVLELARTTLWVWTTNSLMWPWP